MAENPGIEQPSCTHEHTMTFTTGGHHYSQGEVWDDIQERTTCLDCGNELPRTVIDTKEDEMPF